MLPVDRVRSLLKHYQIYCTLGLLRRILKPYSQYVKEQAYFTIVRPIVEYAAAAWNPHTNRDVTKIEQVQKKCGTICD